MEFIRLKEEEQRRKRLMNIPKKLPVKSSHFYLIKIFERKYNFLSYEIFILNKFYLEGCTFRKEKNQRR